MTPREVLTEEERERCATWFRTLGNAIGGETGWWGIAQGAWAAALASRQGEGAAVRDVLVERKRQVSVEGWTPEHDDAHIGGDLARAAACYALPPARRGDGGWQQAPEHWPWDPEWWKPTPTDRRRELVKAGALILAEIERLDRHAPPSDASRGEGKKHECERFIIDYSLDRHGVRCIECNRRAPSPESAGEQEGDK